MTKTQVESTSADGGDVLLSQALGLGPGETPFPWQSELLRRFLAGDVPPALDLPTGLGKTAVMAIWLIARARGAQIPRRLVYVVDRRAVVDQATDVAVALRNLVAESPIVQEGLGLGGRPLPISTLRGQHVDNREWLEDPSAPAIIVGTVDMVGSRLLFEGYGVSRKMRPYHAGLLGADSLIVLDEAHLVPPFEAMVRAASSVERHTLIPEMTVCSLSATGRHDLPRTFRLTPADEQHPVVRRRLDARKRLELRTPIDPAETPLSDLLAREAWQLASNGRLPVRCIVFTNSRDDAEKTAAEIERLGMAEKKASGTLLPDVELFVGARRVYEREEAAKWLREHGFLAGHIGTPAAPAFVVATSAGEVGIDLDADHMVCDVVAWERMVQRLGRVNRRGDRDARVIVIPTLPEKKTREALAERPEARSFEQLALAERAETLDAARELLRQLPRVAGAHDASPRALIALRERGKTDDSLARLARVATSPPPLRPALTRPLLEAWSMTSLEDHSGRPEVQPWIRGWIDEEPQTAIVWRGLLPVGTSGRPLGTAAVRTFFDAAETHTLELLETETRRAVSWLAARLKAVASDASPPEEGVHASADDALKSGEPGPEIAELRGSDVVAFIATANGQFIPIRVDEIPDDGPLRRRKLDQVERALRGATLIVDARLGGLRRGVLSEDDGGAATDVTMTAGFPFRVLDVDSERVLDPSWREELRIPTHFSSDDAPDRWLAVVRPRAVPAFTEDGRSVGKAQLLDEHESWAERHALAIATVLSLPPDCAEMLAVAARLHDEGKKADRWQRAFSASRAAVYGKTTARPNLALLDGYRHEFGSLPYAETDRRVTALPAELRDLCLHLIAAHHGHARPLIPTNGCADAPPSALVERAREVARRFMRLEKQWGPWGLAWWEALLRAADQKASRENDSREEEVSGG